MDSDYDVMYVPYGPGMVERLAQLLELNLETRTKLTARENINVSWMSNRALALIEYLVNRPDENELRRFVSSNRPSFRCPTGRSTFCLSGTRYSVRSTT